MVFTLKRKLLSGFLSLNVLMAAIGGIAIYQFALTGRTIQATTSSTIDEVEVVQGVVDKIGTIRYYGNRFLDVGAPDDRKEALKHLDELTKEITESVRANGNDANSAALQKLGQMLATYREKFEGVATKFEDRVVIQMDRLRDVEEIETTMMTFFSRHRDVIEASRPFLFFMTAKLHLNTYFHTFDDQDYHEMISSLENVKKMLDNGADRWEAAEAEEWREAAKRVGVFVKAMEQCNIDAQTIRKEVRGTLFSLPGEMLELARSMSTRSWQTMQGMSKEISASTKQGQWLVVSALLVACIIGLILPFVVNRSIAKPLGHTVQALRDIAEGEGDLTQRVAIARRDEIGELGHWFNTFVEKIQRTVAVIGNTTHSLANASEELTATNRQMAMNADETSAQAQVVSSATEEVTKNVQGVTAATEELSASVREIAKHASEAAQIATKAVTVADSANSTIRKLGESSQEIGNVVKVITSIAEQTNLLALNATIEAARAGEAGKGFAVVANEVKELAKQTAEATEDISRKISTIQGDTKGAVEAIAQVSQIIAHISDISTTIAGAVEEQSATVNEIGRNVEDAYKGSVEISQNVNQVAQVAHNTASGVSQMQGAAGELASMAAQLQQLVGQFKYDDTVGIQTSEATWEESQYSGRLSNGHTTEAML
ncbi:MAG: methyl-accepting chemotaxis protein [Candidatus Binatia bacterium]